MEKPIIKIIEPQRVESVREVTGYEAEEILRKYGVNQHYSTRTEPIQEIQPGLSFEQMVAQQEAKEKEIKMRNQMKANGPKPITFNGNNYDTEVKYTSDEESGFGFRIEISSDMKLPRY